MPDDFRTLALCNYGHFTSMRATGGRVRGLDLHLERLRRDCHLLFGVEPDLDEIRAECRRQVAGIPVAMLRVTIAGSGFDMSRPSGPVKPEILVTARPAAELPAPPHRVQTVRYQRDLPQVKHVGLFGPIYMRRQAQLAGFDDALFLDADDNAYEGTTWNLVCVSGGQVVWPIGQSLPGVTMRLLRKTYPGTEAYVPRSELAGMDAVAEINANVGVRPITAIDDIQFPTEHPVLDQLRAAYAEVPEDEL